jgi:tape measure domain-containing protein
MPELSRLVLEVDSKGVVTANGNLDLFKKKSDEAAKAASGVETANKNNAKSFDLVNQFLNINTLAIGAAGLAVLKFAQSTVDSAGKMEAIKTQLQVVTGSAKIADATFRELQDFAARTPFSIEGITDTAIQLMQVGVQAKDLQSTLTMLGDVSGGSQEKLNRIMMNYTQILSVGKASTMDIRQFAQANLPIYQELANVTGKSGEALQDMITNGEITGKVVTDAFQRMTAEGGKFFNGMGLAADTYQGKLSTMKDSVSNLAAKFGELWLLDFEKKAIDAITSVSDWAANKLEYLINLRDAKQRKESGNETIDDEIFLTDDRIAYLEKLIRTETIYMENGEKVLSFEGKRLQAELDSERARSASLAMRKRYEGDVAYNVAQYEEGVQTASANSAKKAIEETEKWQKAIKSALDLEDVSTESQAVTDYINNIETSLNGSLAFAQAFGGSVLDVYEDYSDRVKKAVHELLQSGIWTPDEATIQPLISFANRLEAAGQTTGFKTPQFGDAPDPSFMNTSSNPFSLSPFGSITGFNVGYSESDAIWLDDEKVRKEEEQAVRLAEIYRNLGEQLKQFAADATFDALWDMGEALYEGGNAAEAFGRSLLQSILRNVPAMLFQTGFQMAISGNVYGGLALMAISGLGAVAGGYLTKSFESENDDDEKQRRLENLTKQLNELIIQTKADAEYYLTSTRSKNADYKNSVISSTSVNDAIITKDGKVIQTHPEDYLIATKTPGALVTSNQANVQVTIINSISNEVDVDIQEKTLANGSKELVATIRKLVRSDIAHGEFDSALASRNTAIAGTGRRVSS